MQLLQDVPIDALVIKSNYVSGTWPEPKPVQRAHRAVLLGRSPTSRTLKVSNH